MENLPLCSIKYHTTRKTTMQFQALLTSKRFNKSPSSAEVKETVLHSTSKPSWNILGRNLSFFLYDGVYNHTQVKRIRVVCYSHLQRPLHCFHLQVSRHIRWRQKVPTQFRRLYNWYTNSDSVKRQWIWTAEEKAYHTYIWKQLG